MEIKSLRDVSFDTIFKVFSQAFADYELQLDALQLQTMLRRRGFCPELSFAAFEGKEIVAFTFNGIGNFNGVPTAYDTGTGTLKEYRGLGIATKIFEYSIPYLREAGIGQYLLEVLQHNTKAVSVYRKLGFEVIRKLHYFGQKNREVIAGICSSDVPYSLRPISIMEAQAASGFWDFYPSWQNSFESVQRAVEDFVCLGAFVGTELVGYGIFEPVSGDVTQIAVNSGHRREGIATALLQEMVRLNRNDNIKVVNTDIACDSITDFLKTVNIEWMGSQFEMIRKI